MLDIIWNSCIGYIVQMYDVQLYNLIDEGGC